MQGLIEENGPRPILRLEGPRSLDRVTSPGAASYRKGLQLLSARDLEGSEEALRKAVRDDPRLVPAWRELGAVQAQRQRFDEALRSLARAIDLEPGDPDSLFLQGQCMESLGRGEEAKSCYRVYLRSHPNAPVRLRQLVEKRLARVDGIPLRLPPTAAEAVPGEGFDRDAMLDGVAHRRRIRNFAGLVLLLLVTPSVWHFFTANPKVVAFVNRWAGMSAPYQLELEEEYGPGTPVAIRDEFILWTRQALSGASDKHTKAVLASLPMLGQDLTAGEGSQGSGSEIPSTRLDFLVVRLTREASRSAVLALSILLEHDDELVATRAVTALAHIGTPGAKEKLKLFVDSVSTLEDAMRYRVAREALRDFETTPNSQGGGNPTGGNAARAQDLIKMAKQAFGIKL